MSDAPQFQAGGASFTLTPDPAGIVLKITLPGILATLNRTVTVPLDMAEEVSTALSLCIWRARDMADSLREAGE